MRISPPSSARPIPDAGSPIAASRSSPPNLPPAPAWTPPLLPCRTASRGAAIRAPPVCSAVSRHCPAAIAAYSPAWSPHFHRRLLRGALRLSSGRSGALIATYTESLFGRDVRLTAEAWIGGRSMHFVVREPEGDVPLFISLQIPGPPASVLCGVMSGVAFVSSEPLPSACRIVFIRVPDTPQARRYQSLFRSGSGRHRRRPGGARAQCSRGRPPGCVHARVPGHQPEPGDDAGSGDVREHARPRAFGRGWVIARGTGVRNPYDGDCLSSSRRSSSPCPRPVPPAGRTA